MPHTQHLVVCHHLRLSDDCNHSYTLCAQLPREPSELGKKQRYMQSYFARLIILFRGSLLLFLLTTQEQHDDERAMRRRHQNQGWQPNAPRNRPKLRKGQQNVRIYFGIKSSVNDVTVVVFIQWWNIHEHLFGCSVNFAGWLREKLLKTLMCLRDGVVSERIRVSRESTEKWKREKWYILFYIDIDGWVSILV